MTTPTITSPGPAPAELPAELLRALLAGDARAALDLVEVRASEAPDPAARVRARVARVRLLRVAGRPDEASAELEALYATLDPALPDAERALVALERASDLAGRGQAQAARAALAEAPMVEAAPDDALLRAVTQVAALKALEGGQPAPGHAALLGRLPATWRAGVEAALLMGEGRLDDAHARLEQAAGHATRAGALEERAALLLQAGTLNLVRGEHRGAVRALKEVRDLAVAAHDPLVYASAGALLALAYLFGGDKVNAYAAAIRGLVSLEDVAGPGAGAIFQSLLDGFRQAWGEATYCATAEDYIARRKSGAIT